MEKEKREFKSFDDFTNLYEVQKTLRFELKPVLPTRDWMNKNLEYDNELKTFLKDQNIENAYQTLKPIFDKIHEDFITESLESDAVLRINFSEYFEKYQNRKEVKDEEIYNIEKKLCSGFEEIYKKQAERFKEGAGKDNKGKDILKEKGFSVLTEKGILRYVQKNIEKFKELKSEKNIKEALDNFEGFFTYFGGFNQNRENYYETKKEASTAIAARIVHENLPKFCDNIIAFETQKEKYLNAYNFLKEKGNLLQDKEGNLLYSIKEDIFKINHFNECLSQNQIEEYNKIIGNANYIVNLYNQANKKEGGFKKLSLFKTLYKQIGCGKRDALFFSLNYSKKNDYEKKNDKDIQSVEEVLEMANQTGKKYFCGKSNLGEIKNINDFIEYIKNKENYLGVYWSKMALNTISNKYFSNWHALKDRLKEAKVFTKGKNGDEEDIKIPEAIELDGFFNVLDESMKEIEDKENNTTWKSEGLFFKKSLTEILKNFEENKKNQKRKNLIEQSSKPSQALLALIFDDVQEFADKFIKAADEVLKIKDYSKKEGKEKIKFWMDNAIAINRILKYFLVKESKVKGESIDPVISIGLDILLRSDDSYWFKWYDALRNYLTKKPQDDAKNNKLKLNFENSSLLDGWDINKETSNLCVVLQNTNGNQFLAVLNKDNNTLFQEKIEKGRGKDKIFIENSLYNTTMQGETLEKMEYDFWADVSKMIPKCSTQLKQVIEHFKNYNDDFTFPVGYKVTSGEKFLEECRITKKDFELNNKVFKKNDVSISAMRYELSDAQEKQYIKLFQKEFWEILLKQAKNDVNLPKRDVFIEWKKFCVKKYSELSEWERKYKNALTDWINFCKYFLSKYPKTTLFEYEFKQTGEYNSVDEFYLDVDICSYKLKIDKKINKIVLDKLVQEGKIYLFEIKNQDLNDGKKDDHKNNLHTIYWQAIFKDMQNRPKLNGKAEIFYRKAILAEKLGKVEGRKGKDGKDVIKNFRFSKEKFIFHVPITLNFCLKDRKINDVVSGNISHSPNTCFLGIDRGEKHLAYYSLINQKGEIIKQDTLNMPFVNKDGKPKIIKAEKRIIDKDGKEKIEVVDCKDYNDLLEARSGDRDYARKNWQTIGTIKELKDGYISQVIRKIVDIAIDKEKEILSFMVLENLNIGFKRGRQKIEKQVYQKLELALAKKLNFLVDKNAKNNEIGSVTKALQLTPPVNNFGDIENKKQFGIMLYTKADYTSQTDPITGWRKSIYLKKGSEKYVKDQIINSFDDIGFDGKDFYFDYTVDYLDPKNKKSDKKFQKQWRLYSSKNGVNLDRFRGERNNDKSQWISEPQDILKILKNVFEYFDLNHSLLSQIINEGKNPKKIESKYTGWESLRFAIDMIQQIRNTGVEKRDEDFILSPVRDENGNHFDSRDAKENQPSSGDANGAYNIARKGIIMNEHIKSGLTLFIRDEEWDAWLAGKEIWSAWISKNKKDLYRTKK